jgi:hypothetical protein
MVLVNAMKKHGFSKDNVTEVVSGTAVGPDRIGERWALVNDVPVARFPALWSEYGARAGVVRNAQMGVYAEVSLILWDGVSKGTRNMISEMKRLDKPCYVEIVDVIHPDTRNPLEKLLTAGH